MMLVIIKNHPFPWPSSFAPTILRESKYCATFAASFSALRQKSASSVLDTR